MGIPRWVTLNELAHKYDWKIGAELGVKRGHVTGYLLENKSDLYMYAIDLWDDEGIPPYTGVSWDHNQNYEIFMKRIKPLKERVSIMKMSTEVALEHISFCLLDFVFIDADHRYESVCRDIRHWMPKIRPGGFILGHDYVQYDVKKAVDEYFGKRVKMFSDSVWSVRLSMY